MTPPVTRRAFINLVGRGGGAAAVYATLDAMGLLSVPAYAGPPPLPPGSGRGLRVAILGAGIAGMTAAYELRKAGYRCTILEARRRAGGRVWTLRGGDAIGESDSMQRVTWDRQPHLYWNAGPARLPHHHQGILSYCRELGVPLEVMVNDNRGALLQDDAAFAGRPQAARRVINDTRGFIAELAAKGLQSRLDQPLDEEDLNNVRELLRAFGRLGRDMRYTGSARAGFDEAPGAGEQGGRLHPPLPLAELARAASWRFSMSFGESWTQAATMLQPVGGMDAISRAFTRAVAPLITYDAEVVQMRRHGDGARVIWRDRPTARERAIEADFVICTIPLPALGHIDTDFAAPVKRAIEAGAGVYVPAVKIAFQSDRRWWETEQAMYGGITWTSRDITQIWYPSSGFHAGKGILLGAYIWTRAIGRRWSAMSPPDRLAAAVDDGRRIHPGYENLVGPGASVAWSKVPWSGGAWAGWEDEPNARRDVYPVLLGGDGPFHFAGEHMSYISGWLEGAVRSAHYTIARIAERVRERAPRLTGRPRSG